MLAGSLGLVGAAPAHADETPCMRGVPGDSATATEVDKDADEENETLTSLRLDEVPQLATGKGVGVAIIDPGISTDRKSVVEGRSGSVGVDMCGRRIMKKYSKEDCTLNNQDRIRVNKQY